MRSGGAAAAVMFAHMNVAKANRAAPPSRVMKSYRFIRSPRRRGAKSAGGTSLPAAQRIARHKIRKSRSASGSGQQLSRLAKASASSERQPRCGRQRHHRPQAKDLVPPCHREPVAVGVAAFVPHPPLAERKLLLPFHQLAAGARPPPVHAPPPH